jgi:hypothetical protein
MTAIPAASTHIGPDRIARMDVSRIEQSLLLATNFRGNLPDQAAWTSCSDQILTLSLSIPATFRRTNARRVSQTAITLAAFTAKRVKSFQIEARYRCLIQLLSDHSELIEGGGNFRTPAWPTYTACRLTDDGLRLIPHIIDLFPGNPDFPNWPDRRTLQDLP